MNINLPDRTVIFLQVMKWLAYMGIVFTKVVEALFKSILLMNDRYLAFSNGFTFQISPEQTLHILNAYDETGEITNKFKLFLKFYMYNKENSPTGEEGFSADKFSTFFNSSLLFCSYLIKQNGETPEQYLQHIQRIKLQKNNRTMTFTADDKPLDFSIVSFCAQEKKSPTEELNRVQQLIAEIEQND